MKQCKFGHKTQAITPSKVSILEYDLAVTFRGHDQHLSYELVSKRCNDIF